MKDSDIIKALECCVGLGCDKCKFNDGEENTWSCEWELKNAAMEMLKRQQEELDRLTAEKDNLIRNYKECAMEAVREFVGRLEDRLPPRDSDYCVPEYRQVLFYIDRIVAEMEGENGKA